MLFRSESEQMSKTIRVCPKKINSGEKKRSQWHHRDGIGTQRSRAGIAPWHHPIITIRWCHSWTRTRICSHDRDRRLHRSTCSAAHVVHHSVWMVRMVRNPSPKRGKRRCLGERVQRHTNVRRFVKRGETRNVVHDALEEPLLTDCVYKYMQRRRSEN